MKNQLSALIDGEIDIDSAKHLLTAMKSGGELKEAWQHYHLIGDVMRDESNMRHDFSARVMQSLQAEPTVLMPNNKVTIAPAVANSSYKTSKFWSVAASAAAVLFVGAMVLQQQLAGSEDLSPIEIAESMPVEYLEAHQSVASSNAGYYIQNASYQAAGAAQSK